MGNNPVSMTTPAPLGKAELKTEQELIHYMQRLGLNADIDKTKLKLSPNIAKYLTSLPDTPAGFVDAKADTGEMTLSHYQDWLNWCANRAKRALHQLDEFECQYRKLGYRYHRISNYSRNMVASSHITLSARLKQVFESTVSRPQQSLFVPWHTASKSTTAVLSLVDSTTPYTHISPYILYAYKKCEEHLNSISTALHTIGVTLEALSGMMDILGASHYTRDATREIAERGTVEYNMLRAWMWTFPDILGSRGDTKTNVEGMVQVWLGGGVKMEKLWGAGKMVNA